MAQGIARTTQTFLIAVVLALLGASDSASARFSEISPSMARALVASSLTENGHRPLLAPFDGDDPRFYFFEQVGADTGGHILSIAVNKISGDIWAIDGMCRHVFPRLTIWQLRALRPPRNILPPQCGGTAR